MFELAKKGHIVKLKQNKSCASEKIIYVDLGNFYRSGFGYDHHQFIDEENQTYDSRENCNAIK